MSKRLAVGILAVALLLASVIAFIGMATRDSSAAPSSNSPNSTGSEAAVTNDVQEATTMPGAEEVSETVSAGSGAVVFPTVTAPDGTPLDGPTVLSTESAATSPVETTELPVEVTASPDVPESTTTVTATTVLFVPEFGMLEQAEAFAREFYTYGENDTPEQWKERVSAYTTAELEARLHIEEFDAGISIGAAVWPLQEATGNVGDTAAEQTVWVTQSQYDRGELVRTIDLPINLILVKSPSGVWLVSDYFFYK